MNLAVRTGLPERVTSRTSTTPRVVTTSMRRPGLGRHDVERLDALARIDHGLDSIALHPRMLRRRSARRAAHLNDQVAWIAISKVAL